MQKIFAFAAGVAALVLTLSAVADASTGLTMPTNTLVPLGTRLLLRSNNWKIANTKFGTITCSSVQVETEVTRNEKAGGSPNSGVEAVGTANLGFGTNCTIGGTPATLKELQLSKIKSPDFEPGKATWSFSFITVGPGSQTCKYTATNAASTYSSGGSELFLTGVPLSASPASCISRTPEVSASFEISTKAGGAVFIV